MSRMEGVPQFVLTIPPLILHRAMSLFRNDDKIDKNSPDFRIYQLLVIELLAQIQGIAENKDMPKEMLSKAEELKVFLEESVS